MRPIPDGIVLRRGSSSLWVARDFGLDPKLDVLADPDLLFSLPQCEVIKDQRKIKVGRVPLEIGGKVIGIYLKRYNAFSWRYRLVSLLVPSAARRSWAGARVLTSAGFDTGQPIAAVECRTLGMLKKSFYLSEEIPNGKTVDVYWRQELASVNGPEGFRRRRHFLKGLAKLFFSLHGANIYHNDLKDANILVRAGSHSQDESLYLLDLEGIRSYRCLNRRRRIKNLVQLNRTMGRFLRRSERLYWLKAYLGDVFLVRAEKRKWIRAVLEKSGREDRRSQEKMKRQARGGAFDNGAALL